MIEKIENLFLDHLGMVYCVYYWLHPIDHDLRKSHSVIYNLRVPGSHKWTQFYSRQVDDRSRCRCGTFPILDSLDSFLAIVQL